MKKLFSVLVSLVLVVALCFGGAFCVSADDGYGTFENGIVPSGKYQDGKVPPTDKFMNGDFQEGLRYWTTRDGNAPSQNAKLITEGDNTYIEFTPTNEWDGIISPFFTVPEAKVGMKLAVFFKWRGEGSIQIAIEHQNGTEPSSRVGNGSPVLLKEATDENGWNLAMSGVSSPVMELKDGIVDETHRFQVYAQITVDLETKIQIDDLQFCIYRDDVKKLFALDGTTVVADIAALEEEMAGTDEDFEEDDSFGFEEEDDTDADTDTDISFDEDTDADTDTDASDDTTGADDKSEGLGIWLWVIIGAGVLVAAAVVVIIIVIKKKKAVPAIEGEEPPADVTE